MSVRDQIEATLTRLGYALGTTGDPKAGQPFTDGIVACIEPECRFGDGISAVAVAPTFVQKWFRPYPWGHTDWRPVGQRIPYSTEAELSAALADTAKLKKGMWV